MCAPAGVSIACGNGGSGHAPTLQRYLDQTITYEVILHEPTMSSTTECPLLARKRPSAPPPKGPLTEVLRTKYAHGEFVSS